MTTVTKRRRVMAGNWKMYKTLAATREFFEAFLPLVQEVRDRDIVVCPPFTAINTAVEETWIHTGVAIGAQDVYWGKEGALTSFSMRPTTGWRKNLSRSSQQV
jgi:triosephosphate isomerase